MKIKKQKIISIQQLTNAVKLLQGQSPILQTLINCGNSTVLPEIISHTHKNENHKNVYPNNRFTKLLTQSDYITFSPQKSTQLSFVRYKTNPQQLLLKSSIKKKQQSKKIKTQQTTTYQSPTKKKVITYPIQLSNLKQQLLKLPSVGIQSNKQQQKTQQINLSFRLKSSQRQSLENTSKQHHNQQKSQLMIQLQKYKNKAIMSKYQQQRKLFYQQHIHKILDYSKNNQKKMRIGLNKTDVQKWDKAGQRLSKFLGYSNPPSQIAMNVLGSAQEIQQSQYAQIKRQILEEQKNSGIQKFKRLIQYQQDYHRKNVKKMLENRRQYRLDLAKADFIKSKKKSKQKNDADKIYQFQLESHNKNINKSLKDQGKLFNCNICIKSNQ